LDKAAKQEIATMAVESEITHPFRAADVTIVLGPPGGTEHSGAYTAARQQFLAGNSDAAYALLEIRQAVLRSILLGDDTRPRTIEKLFADLLGQPVLEVVTSIGMGIQRDHLCPVLFVDLKASRLASGEPIAKVTTWAVIDALASTLG
jgi:hypothetical protein